MRYRRAAIKGATYFFTVNVAERHSHLLVDNIQLLYSILKKVKERHCFKINAMVVLPDHLHAIWTLPENDNDYGVRWMLIKTGFSRGLPKMERVNRSRQQKRERGI